MRRRILNILIAIDQFVWVLITLGDGCPDETLSAAAWRMERQGKLFGRVFRPVFDVLFYFLERDHCYRSYKSEIIGRQLPNVYRSLGR